MELVGGFCGVGSFDSMRGRDSDGKMCLGGSPEEGICSISVIHGRRPRGITGIREDGRSTNQPPPDSALLFAQVPFGCHSNFPSSSKLVQINARSVNNKAHLIHESNTGGNRSSRMIRHLYRPITGPRQWQ